MPKSCKHIWGWGEGAGKGVGQKERPRSEMSCILCGAKRKEVLQAIPLEDLPLEDKLVLIEDLTGIRVDLQEVGQKECDGHEL